MGLEGRGVLILADMRPQAVCVLVSEAAIGGSLGHE